MSETSPQANRHFLGWDAPLLPRAAAWLWDRFGPQELGEVMVVVPGARSGRRLVELLVEQSTNAGLVPPRVVTVGGLPEMLYDASSVADPLPALLTRARALSQAPRTLVEAVTAYPPDSQDTLGWVNWAEELAGVSQLLGAEGLSAADVADRAERGELGLELDGQRWRAIGDLDAAYRRALADQGLIDKDEARTAALRAIREPGEAKASPEPAFSALVFVGLADMPGITRQLVSAALDPSGTTETSPSPSKRTNPGSSSQTFPTHVLIAAPESESAMFGPLGEVLTEPWAARQLEIDDQAIHVADRPRDQARAVVDLIGQASPNEQLSPADCVVGVGDSDAGGLVGSVRRHLELGGVPCRAATGLAGDAVSHSRPGRLLSAVGAYLRSRRFDDFAALLRHPDLGVDHEAADGWLTLLDTYLTDHVQGVVSGHWLPRSDDSTDDEDSTAHSKRHKHEVKRAANLKRIYERIETWLPQEPDTLRALPDWTGDLARMLTAVYERLDGGSTQFNHRASPDPQSNPPWLSALSQIGEALGELADLDAQAATTPRVTGDQAISLLVRLLDQRTVPPEADQAAVEVLGYLELVLDDAPLPILVGVNEGSMPASVTAHPLLPDSLRTRLALADNQRRLARDIYALTVITHSRPEAKFITGQRSAEGDPLAPSRLLLACDPEQLVERVTKFYSEDAEATSEATAPPLLHPGVSAGPTQLRIPKPTDPATPERQGHGTDKGAMSDGDEGMNRLSVTAFRDYITCPYRFYLKHVRKLDSVDDQAVEMDGALFGNVAHAVLGDFGQSDLASSTNEEPIANFFRQKLDAEIRRRFGPEPVAAIQLQAQQLSERLATLAHRQVSWNLAGWTILPEHIEQRYEAQLDVDGSPFTIIGQIDRIDRHAELGYRIIDYKTADAGDTPDKIHRRNDQWTDLQLPLYRQLAQAANIDGPIQLGFINLPRDLEQVNWVDAQWDVAMLESAAEEAHRIIRQIREGVFWPPSPKPPPFDDGFKGICYDRVHDRRALLATKS